MKHPFSRLLFGFGDKAETVEEEQENDDNQVNQVNQVKQVTVDKIIPNQFQPRSVFSDERIEELAQTIEEHGIIQPIVVRRKNEQYELIAGERRLRAVQKLGWESIPAIVKEMNDEQTASVALIENLQREELTAIEEAVAYVKLIEIHGLTQEGLAKRLGKGQSTIANKLRLLKLPEPIQEALLLKQITERHARALIPLKISETQAQLLQEIIEKNLNVKQTEERVKSLLEGTQKKKKPVRKSYSKDMRLAMNTIRESVNMVLETGLTIDTDEEEHEEYYQFTIRIPKN